MFGLGCYEVSLGDTIGHGSPETVAAMLDAVLAAAPAERLAGHYHDTNARALESVAVSMAKGLRVFDSAVGGLGGCPYAPGAKGNLSTGALARDLEARQIDTGLDLVALEEVEAFVSKIRDLLE
jgi:hydroxymethylglutaryl-CoA lyase